MACDVSPVAMFFNGDLLLSEVGTKWGPTTVEMGTQKGYIWQIDRYEKKRFTKIIHRRTGMGFIKTSLDTAGYFHTICQRVHRRYAFTNCLVWNREKGDLRTKKETQREPKSTIRSPGGKLLGTVQNTLSLVSYFKSDPPRCNLPFLSQKQL